MEKLYGDPTSRTTHKGLDQRSKMEELVPKMACRRGSDVGNPRGSECDPAEGVPRRYKKNYHSILSCIGKRTTEGCDRSSDVRTVYSR